MNVAELVFIVVVGAGILVALVAVPFGLVIGRRQHREKMRWASANGWNYTKNERYLTQQWRGRMFESSGRTAHHIYRREVDGVNLIVFTLMLGEGSGSQVPLVGRELEEGLPVMTLEPPPVSDSAVMKFMDKLTSDGEHTLDISDPYWSVSVPDTEDDDAVRRALSAPVMRFLGRDDVMNLQSQIYFAGSYVFMTNRGTSEPQATWKERVDTRLWVLGELAQLTRA